MDNSIDYEKTLEKCHGRTQLVNELLSIFADELPSNKAVIKTAYEHQDLKTLSNSLHRLRGSCAYVSLPRLQVIVENSEKHLETAQVLDQEKYQSLINEIDTILLELKAHVDIDTK